MIANFKESRHTFIVSDIHLSDAEPPHPFNPFWKRFKRPKFFVDRTFRRFLERIQEVVPEPKELILNGDIFDFDSVMVIPDKPRFSVSWLERRRGLFAEEVKSRFKIRIILQDHPQWVQALREFILKGNRVVFVIGNHDMELHWPSVRQEILKHLDLSEQAQLQVRFCEWFYISNQDTLVEHGNQYDDYCMCADPVHPLIKKGSKIFVRLPFGNLANKFMMNGMGLMNPHVDSSFIKSSIKEYLVFFYRYVIRTQPFLVWTWFWGAMSTLFYSVTEGLLPALKDPLTVVERVDGIAERANSDARTVRALTELHAHPAIFNPFRILRELWLDRILFLGMIFFFGFQIFSFLNFFARVSIGWFVVPIVVLLPAFIFYARSVESDVLKVEQFLIKNVPFSSRLARVKRVIFGHTHRELHRMIDGVELLNTGTWSAAYNDVECTQPYGKKVFAWIQPEASGNGRRAHLYEWKDPDFELMTPEDLESNSQLVQNAVGVAG